MKSYGRARWSTSNNRDLYQSNSRTEEDDTPQEFICPISGSIMADPVVVSSGHSFERVSVQVCRELRFSPELDDGSRADLSTVFDNRTMKSMIRHWCDELDIAYPQSPGRSSVERIVRNLMEPRSSETELLRNMSERPVAQLVHAETDLGPRINQFLTNSYGESATVSSALPFTTRPSCYSSSTSSNESISEANEDRLLDKLESSDLFDQEDAVNSLRKITRSKEESRLSLCTPRLLLALKSLISSKISTLQFNALASLVNLSLQNPNKVKIVRSGFIPVLIQVLKEGSNEAVEHAVGALFSLALEDENRTAIGALGALPYLMEALRSEREQTRNDSALCLYNLTLAMSNRAKLVKLGAVQTLLLMAISGNSTNRALLILVNLSLCPEGRSAMLDGNAVSLLVKMMRENELDSESTRENCVSVLYGLSQGGLRFKGLAREARAAEVLRAVEARGSETAREKAKRILQMMKGIEDDDDRAGRESVPGSGGLSWTRDRVGTYNSTKF